MTVVVDASVLIALASLRRLDLIRLVLAPDAVYIPDAVWQEVVVQGGGRPAAVEIARCPWVQRRSPSLAHSMILTSEHLDPGEAEAIALAHEVKADVVLMDEKAGRRAAQRSGLRVLGTLGLLLQGKRTGVLAQVKPELDGLARAGFYIAHSLREEVLKRAGEAP